MGGLVDTPRAYVGPSSTGRTRAIAAERLFRTDSNKDRGQSAV
jgi:hypothetical protein